MSRVQAVIFKNSVYTPKEAEQWLKKNKFHPIKAVHKTKNYLRYRIEEPDNFHIFRLKSIEHNNIKMVMGYE